MLSHPLSLVVAACAIKVIRIDARLDVLNKVVELAKTILAFLAALVMAQWENSIVHLDTHVFAFALTLMTVEYFEHNARSKWHHLARAERA